MKSKLFINMSILACSIMLSGCRRSEAIKMPDDYNISLQYGVDGKNEINTYTNTITKDLVIDGTKSVMYEIPKEDLQNIYTKFMKLGINRIKHKLVQEDISMSPLVIYKLEYTIKNRTYEIYGDGTMNTMNCEEAKHFTKFINYVIKYIESTDAYKELPEAKGGYD